MARPGTNTGGPAGSKPGTGGAGSRPGESGRPRPKAGHSE